MVSPEEITKQAKAIMDNFMSSLSKVKDLNKYGVIREKSTRIPKDNDYMKSNPKFQSNILKNAPKTNDDCIQAEKKHW